MKFSVIITSFNAEKYIARAIESFLVQDYQDKELLIIDGISTDKTHEIISNYAEKFPQFIKWITEKDRGISHARNIALKHVSGDLVGFLGADDFLHKDFFKEADYYIKVNPDFDVIYFNNYCVGLRSEFSASSSIMVTKRNLIKHCPIACGEAFYYKKEVLKKFGFNEQNKYCMDYELNFQIASSKKEDGKKFMFYPVNIVAVFNENTGENQSSLNSMKQRFETMQVQMKYSANLFEKLRILVRNRKIIMKNFFKN